MSISELTSIIERNIIFPHDKLELLNLFKNITPSDLVGLEEVKDIEEYIRKTTEMIEELERKIGETPSMNGGFFNYFDDFNQNVVTELKDTDIHTFYFGNFSPYLKKGDGPSFKMGKLFYNERKGGFTTPRYPTLLNLLYLRGNWRMLDISEAFNAKEIDFISRDNYTHLGYKSTTCSNCLDSIEFDSKDPFRVKTNTYVKLRDYKIDGVNIIPEYAQIRLNNGAIEVLENDPMALDNFLRSKNGQPVILKPDDAYKGMGINIFPQIKTSTPDELAKFKNLILDHMKSYTRYASWTVAHVAFAKLYNFPNDSGLEILYKKALIDAGGKYKYVKDMDSIQVKNLLDDLRKEGVPISPADANTESQNISFNKEGSNVSITKIDDKFTYVENGNMLPWDKFRGDGFVTRPRLYFILKYKIQDGKRILNSGYYKKFHLITCTAGVQLNEFNAGKIYTPSIVVNNRAGEKYLFNNSLLKNKIISGTDETYPGWESGWGKYLTINTDDYIKNVWPGQEDIIYDQLSKICDEIVRVFGNEFASYANQEKSMSYRIFAPDLIIVNNNGKPLVKLVEINTSPGIKGNMCTNLDTNLDFCSIDKGNAATNMKKISGNYAGVNTMDFFIPDFFNELMWNTIDEIYPPLKAVQFKQIKDKYEIETIVSDNPNYPKRQPHPKGDDIKNHMWIMTPERDVDNGFSEYVTYIYYSEPDMNIFKEAIEKHLRLERTRAVLTNKIVKSSAVLFDFKKYPATFLENFAKIHYMKVPIDFSNAIYFNINDFTGTFASCVIANSPELANVLFKVKTGENIGNRRIFKLKGITFVPMEKVALNPNSKYLVKKFGNPTSRIRLTLCVDINGGAVGKIESFVHNSDMENLSQEMKTKVFDVLKTFTNILSTSMIVPISTMKRAFTCFKIYFMESEVINVDVLNPYALAEADVDEKVKFLDLALFGNYHEEYFKRVHTINNLAEVDTNNFELNFITNITSLLYKDREKVLEDKDLVDLIRNILERLKVIKSLGVRPLESVEKLKRILK